MQIKSTDRYKTILVIVTGVLLLGMIFEWKYVVWASAAIGAVCIMSDKAAAGIEWFWIRLANILGWINSRIILTIIYFVFLLPIAWVSRAFTNDPLHLRRRKTKSIFSDRNHVYTKKDLENIW